LEDKAAANKPTLTDNDREHKLKHHDHGNKHTAHDENNHKPKGLKKSNDDNIADELLHLAEEEKKEKHMHHHPHHHHPASTGAVH